jgi:hypothetical protein
MMGLWISGNGSHQKHNHTKDPQQPSLIIIAGMLFIVQGAFQRNVFEIFELCNLYFSFLQNWRMLWYFSSLWKREFASM